MPVPHLRTSTRSTSSPRKACSSTGSAAALVANAAHVTTPNSNPRHSSMQALATTTRLVDWRTHACSVNYIYSRCPCDRRAPRVAGEARLPVALMAAVNPPHRLEFPGFAETAHEDRPHGDRCVRYHVPCLVR